MALTPEQQRTIATLLNEKLRPCAACGVPKTWNLVSEGIVYAPLQAVLSSQALPCVALVCSNCGHMQLHHVFTLGLGPLLGIKPMEA